MNRLKEYLSIEQLFILVANLSQTSIIVSCIASVFIMPTLSILGKLSNIGSALEALLTLAVTFIFIQIIFIPVKFAILPITYTLIDKYGKSEILLSFIRDLKTNNLFRKNVLIYALLLDVALMLIGNYHRFINNNFNLGYTFFHYLISGGGLFGAYLVLFLWWDWKEKKQKYKIVNDN